MSHQATTWAYRQPISNAGRKFVLVALSDFADEAWSCYPGQERLAAMTGQDVRSVRRHLEALESAGFIRRQARFLSNGRRTSDRYQLVVKVAEVALDPPDNLTGGQYDLRSETTSPPDNLSGEPLENHQSYPLTPGKPGECNPDHPTHTNCRGCGNTRRGLAKAAKTWRPTWCGDCDDNTRLLDYDGDHPYPCPACHPTLNRKATA